MSQGEKADQAVLDNLEILGSDTGEDHPVEFFLYFPTEWKAYTTATQLINLQFEVNVSFSEYSGDWLCLAIKEIEPSSDRIHELRNFLENLAQSNDGKYDGWGTPVVDKNDDE